MPMENFHVSSLDPEKAFNHLMEQGYVVIEGMLSGGELVQISDSVNELFKLEREKPYDPGDAPSFAKEDEIKKYISTSYKISDDETDRVMRRIRHTRAENYDTPWPVTPDIMNKSFIHVPTLFDYDKSQRIWNLPAKLKQCGRLIEDPVLLRLVREVLGQDCLLSDISATSIGPNSGGGGAWHIDAPLTQMPEPLPEISFAVQNVWILDDFTTENGATRVVPGSHLTRKKPIWGYDLLEREIALTAPAGSLAMWTSHTWHRSGENVTGDPRRAILGYYVRSWVRSWSDYTESLPEETVRNYSSTVRYLLGFSANALRRG
jgi:hypothetical protein